MSSKVFALLSSAKRKGVHITLGNGDLAVKVSKGTTIEPALLQEIKDNKQAIIDFLGDTSLVAGKVDQSQEAIATFDRNEVRNIPLSFSQERLWFIDQMEGTVQYHIPVILRLKGNLDIAALRHALTEVVNRHEALRTVIREVEGQGYQYILPADSWELTITDGASYQDAATLKSYVHTLTQAPFDLSSGHMLRAELIRLSETEQVLVATMHHIASDGWSASILVREVVELYQSFTEKRPAHLQPLPVQYADYALWQRTYLQGEVWENKLNYWKTKLEGAAALQLPTDHPRPALQTTHGATTSFQVNKDIATRLQAFSQQQGTTLFMTLLAGFKVLLHRYSGQEDITVGTPIANRTQHETEQLIGFFVNTLALRSEVNGAESFTQLVQQVKTTTLEAYTHQDVPFEKVVETVMKSRDLSRSPLFQVMFVLQNTPDVPELKFGDVQLSAEGFTQQTAKYDLSLFVTDNGNGLQGAVEYNTDLYEEATIRKMLVHFEQLLLSVLENPAQEVGRLAMLQQAEEAQLLFEFNDTDTAFPQDKSIVDLFELQATKTPDATALVFETESLSYRELNERSNQLAHYLQERGVTSDTLVPVCIERSVGMITAILGILKAGGAYVPIDPEYPQDRISYMLEDTGAKLVVSSEQSRSKLANNTGLEIIEPGGKDASEINKQPISNLATKPAPGQLIYVIYTSGSTGKPKGVMITHTSVINLLLSVAESVGFKQTSALLSVTTYSFDISYLEFYLPLITGAKLILASSSVVGDGFKLAWLIKTFSPSHMQATPSTWQLLLDAEWKNAEGITMLIGGEAVKEDLKESLAAIGELHNMYGPTETTIWSATKKLFTGEKVLLGKPVANTQVYIFNQQLGLVPVGVAGEICISGAGLATGYLHRAELTAEKFIDHPFAKLEGKLLYKTGDLGRWLEDGNLEYLGRIDEQVKIRGYRIELGEIETVLEQTGLLKSAVVIARDDAQGNKRLVGYLVPGENFDKEAVLSFAKSKLPEYMLPGIWVEVAQLPLTPNGKIDRKALPNPQFSDQSSVEYVAPQNSTQEQLAEIWKKLLGVERVGIYDNFFEIGGHSLLAMRVIATVRRELQVELNVKDIFSLPTIQGLSNLLQSKEKASSLPLVTARTPRPERIPLSFSQERLWFIDQVDGSVQYHSTVVLRLKGVLHKASLSMALETIVDRHEILRSVYEEEGGQVVQEIMQPGNWQFKQSQKPEFVGDEKGLKGYIQRLIHNPFDLSADYMLRSELIEIEPENHVLVVTIHHIASDAWSIPVIVGEVAELYSSFLNNRVSTLQPLPLQYADYALWQRDYLTPDLLHAKLDYWKQKLEGTAPLQLATDYTRPAALSNRGAARSFLIEPELATAVTNLAQANGTTLYMSLLAAFKVLLYRYSGQNDICVGTSIAGRPQEELEKLIGFFVNTLALRDEVNGNVPFTELLQAVKATTLEAYEHQEVPFEKVVEAVVKERDASRSPLFQVMLVLQNTPDAPKLQLGDLRLSGEAYEQTTVKFELTFFINQTSRGLQGTVEYSTDLYTAETIDRMTVHFTQLLRSIVSTPHEKLGQLEMLTSKEQKELSSGFNHSSVAVPAEESIVSLFEQQVIKVPGNTAVVFEGEKLSYTQLNEQANQLARLLADRGVVAGSLVPVCMERSADMLVAILAILKAGGAYVPIDVDFPAERIEFMLSDIGASFILTNHTTQLAPEHGLVSQVIIIELDNQAGLEKFATTDLDIKPGAADLAYLIYTSGSTGRPKGVMIEHRNLVDYVYGLNDKTGIEKCLSYALVSTIATDLGNTVIFSSLLFGGALHIFSKETTGNVDALHRYFRLHSIDCLKIVPSHWKALSLDEKSLLPLKLLIFGGEALPAETIEQIQLTGSSCRIVNHYGPTETTIGKLLHVIEPGRVYNGTVPIGKPFSNTNVYVLNQEFQLSPVGVLGELFIGGAGVARGYLNNDELTAQKFITDPFDSTGNSVVYRTGDLVKYLPDGNILFAGRVDDQVKIRGYRVEIGEVESILQQGPGVSQAVVVAREDKQGNKRLAGYVVAAGAFEQEEIMAYMKAKLPEFMVPSVLIKLDFLPLTANGKINRKALPEADHAEQASDNHVLPRNEVEQMLAQIWGDVLEVENVGIHDDFFELGGHSLLAIRLISAVRKALNVEVPISDVFDYPTIAALATHLAEEPAAVTIPVIQALKPRPNFIPLSFSQERLWFIDQLDGSAQYHVPSVLRLKGNLNKTALAYAIQTIVNRHEVLRTVIRENKGQAGQHVMEPGLWQLATSQGIKYKAYREQLQDHIQDLINTPFDLTKDHMLRAELITVNAHEHVLVVVMHHIASDGWSASLLVKEVVALYKSFVEGLAITLDPMKIQYADFAIWQRSYLEGETLKGKLAYWENRLAGVATLDLPTDYQRPAVQSSKGAVSGFRLPKQVQVGLQELSQQQGTTMFMTLLAAFKVLLFRYSAQQDICVGTAVAGRQQQELENLIGFFINTLALRTEIDPADSFEQVLRKVKLTTLEAYENQDVPFEKVVNTVVKERNMSRSPLFQVMFALQNTPPVPDLLLGEVKLTREPFSHDKTKFDLSVVLTEVAHGVHGTIQYCTDLYSEQRILRMIEHFELLLNSVIAAPAQKIDGIPILSSQEREQLLSQFNQAVIPTGRATSILELFANQVQTMPGALALSHNGVTINYRELDQRSTELASFLVQKGITTETLVPVCMNRSIELIVALLGVLKAGGA